MSIGLGLTNATKAIVMVIVSAVLGLITSLGLDLSGEQVGYINTIVDGILGLWIALTYKDSPKRVEDEDIAAAFDDVDLAEDGSVMPTKPTPPPDA
jgi:hypothetical protein